MRSFALAYAALGFPVQRTHKLNPDGSCTCNNAACDARGKHPIGKPAPTTDKKEIASWPELGYSLGIYPDARFFVLDIDAKDSGLTTLARWEVEHGRLPRTATVRTGGGGFHFYFSLPQGHTPLKNRVRIAQGVDVRAKGAFVVAPPSVHASGVAYAWDTERGNPKEPLAPAPAWLLELVTPKDVFEGLDLGEEIPAVPEGERLARARAALAGHPDAIQGQGGDLTTLQACSIGYDYGVSQAVWTADITAWNLAHCDPAWEPGDLLTKLESAYKHNAPDKPFGWKLRPIRRDPEGRALLSDPSEHGLASAFVRELGAEVKIVSSYLHVYDATAGCWRMLTDAQAIGRVLELHGRDVVTADGKSSTVNMTAKKAKEIYTHARHMREYVDDTFFESRRRGVMCSNGFVTVKDGVPRLEDPSPDHRVLNALPYPYDPDADYSDLEDLLRNVWQGDEDVEEKIAAFQEFYGAALLGMATDYARALMNVGGGANGKTTLMRIMEKVIPPELRASIAPQQWNRQEYVIELYDKLLNSVSEIPERRFLANDTFKQIIGGDPLSARRLWGQVQRFRPYAGHVFSANELPEMDDHSHGLWRRWLVLNYNRNFEHDPARKTVDQINEMFAGKEPAILRWCIEGAARLVLQGAYTEPSSHLVTLADWKRDTDNVASVAAKCFVLTPNEKTQSSELYATYKEAAEAEGLRPASHVAFGRRMAKLYGRPVKSNGKTFYHCVIRHEAEWDIARPGESFKERRTYTSDELKQTTN